MPGRISLATFLHLKTNEPPEDRALSLTAILADAINLGLAKMAEICPGTSLAKPAWSWPGTSVMRRTVRHWPSSFCTSALQRTGAKELPSLLMGIVIVLAGAESAAQINARYGSDPSVTLTPIFRIVSPVSPQGDQRNVRDATHAK